MATIGFGRGHMSGDFALPEKWKDYQWIYDELLNNFNEVRWKRLDYDHSLVFLITNKLNGFGRYTDIFKARVVIRGKDYPDKIDGVVDVNLMDNKEELLNEFIQESKHMIKKREILFRKWWFF